MRQFPRLPSREPREPGPGCRQRATARGFCRTSSLELLRTHDPGSLANDDELIGCNARDFLRRAVGPADREVGRPDSPETEMQATIIRGVEARLRGDLLCLRAGSVAGGHAG